MKFLKKVIVAFLIVLLLPMKVEALTTVNIDISGSRTINVGEKTTIKFNFNENNFELLFAISANNSYATPNETVFGNGFNSVVITGKSLGSTTFTIVDRGSSVNDDSLSDAKAVGSFTINVVKPTTSDEKKPVPPSTGDYDTNQNKETEAERKAREEREAAQKAQAEKEAAEKELEKKKKTPLIGEISILSESERLKGKEVVKLETEFENFKYSAKLPRSVDAFKLDLKPIADDVTLTYDAMYKLDEGHDKVEITVKAVQGEIEQTFNLTVNRHVESKVTLTQEDKNYSLLVDDLIDGKMKELGVTRNLFNKEKDDTFYYYEYEGIKFALVYDADKVARWVIMDDKGAFVEEVILIIDQNKKPRFIVDVPLDEDVPTLNGNRYEQTNLTLPKEILALDESMNFNDQVSAWVYDETGFITHEYVPVENKDVATTEDSFVDVDQDSPYQLVYVGNDASVQTAFVAFDGVNNNMTTLVYVLSGLLVALALAFIIYWRTTSKKIKVLLTRR